VGVDIFNRRIGDGDMVNNEVALLRSYALASTPYAVVTFLLPQYIEFLGGSLSDVGYAYASYAFALALSRPLLGNAVDRAGRVPSYRLGLVLLSLSLIALSASWRVSMILVCMFMIGVASSMINVSSLAMAADIGGLEEPRIYSKLRMGAVTGALIGGALAIPLGWLVSLIDPLLSIRLCFSLVGILSMIGFVLSLHMIETKHLAIRYMGGRITGFMVHISASLIFGLSVGLYGPIVIPILTGTFHASTYEAAVLYAPAVFSWMIGTRLARPSPMSMILGSIICSIALYSMYSSETLPQFLFSWYLEGIGYSLIATSLDQYVSRLMRGEVWGLSFGLYSFAYNIAYTVGAVISGNLAPHALLISSALMMTLITPSLLIDQRLVRRSRHHTSRASSLMD